MFDQRVLWVALIAGWATSAGAQELKPAAAQQIVEKAAAKYAAAFVKQDAAAIAGLFTPEAEYVDGSGTVFHGRKVIQAEMAASFKAGGPGSLEIEILSIRPIASGLLVEEGASTFVPEKDGPRVQTRYAATHVKQADGTWLIASVRETGYSSPSPHDRLQSLGWLVGAWHEEVNGHVVSTEWKWSEDGNFLLSEFAIQRPDEGIAKGTHRIGWNGETNQFRSWIFDADGGSAEGWWHQNADQSWSVQLTRIGAEGIRTSSQVTYAPDGKDAIVVVQDQLVSNGVALPGNTHRVVRKPPVPNMTQTR